MRSNDKPSPTPHYATCPGCRELVESALDELHHGARAILRLATSESRGIADDDATAHEIANRAVTVAAAWLALNAALADAEDHRATAAAVRAALDGIERTPNPTAN